MKPTSFITLTFCTFALGTAALASEPIAVQNTNNTSIALLTGEAFSWTGFYIGGNIGGSLNNYDFRGPFADGDHLVIVDQVQQFNEELGQESDQDSVAFFFLQRQEQLDGSLMGGGQVGFQYQFGHFVVGVEGDFERLAANASVRRTEEIGGFFEPDETVFADTVLDSIRKAETTWNASVRGRVGWAHGPFLFYGTGGIAWADVRTWASDIAATTYFAGEGPGDGGGGGALAPAQAPPGFTFLASTTTRSYARDNDTHVGWTAGGGIAIALTEVLSIGLEYRHSDFGDETYHYNNHGVSPGEGIFVGDSKIDLYSDQVTLRVNLLLNRFFGH